MTHKANAIAGQGTRLADASMPIADERQALYQLAFERARQSGALKPDAAQITALEQHATGVVRSHNTEPFDAVKNLDDHFRQEQFEKDKADADEQEQAVAHAQAKVRECREQAAKTQVGEEPRITATLWIVIGAAVVALAATLIPTVRDTLSMR